MNRVDVLHDPASRNAGPGQERARLAMFAVSLALVGLLASGSTRDLYPATADTVVDLTNPNMVAGAIRLAQPSQPPLTAEQQALAGSLARRYRVAEEAMAGFVAIAYQAGAHFSVDPLLVIAVIAVESRFNPVAESVMGAKGLMQIIPRFHGAKLRPHGGEALVLDPVVNILVGTQILAEYRRRSGETETALQMYAGAFDDPNAQYAQRVLTERNRLEQVLARTRREA